MLHEQRPLNISTSANRMWTNENVPSTYIKHMDNKWHPPKWIIFAHNHAFAFIREVVVLIMNTSREGKGGEGPTSRLFVASSGISIVSFWFGWILKTVCLWIICRHFCVHFFLTWNWTIRSANKQVPGPFRFTNFTSCYDITQYPFSSNSTLTPLKLNIETIYMHKE